MESQKDEPPQRLRYQSRSRRRRSSSSRHDGHKVYPVTLNDSAPSHSLRVRPHLEQFIISSFRHCLFNASRVSRNGGTRTRTERHLKPTPLPNWATFRPAPGVTRDQRHKVMTRCHRPIRGVEPVSGWCRIRTCGTSRFTCFQDRRVRPLRQPSKPDILSGRSGYGPPVHDWHPMSGTPRCVERSGGRIGFYRQRRGQRYSSYAPSGRAMRSVTNRAGSSPARALPPPFRRGVRPLP